MISANTIMLLNSSHMKGTLSGISAHETNLARSPSMQMLGAGYQSAAVSAITVTVLVGLAGAR